MMQPKRILIALLVVILTISLAGLIVSAEESNRSFDAAVEVSSSTAVSNDPCYLKAGDTVNVSIMIKTNTGFAFAAFDIDYDKNALTPETDDKGNIASFTVGEDFKACEPKFIVRTAGTVKCTIGNPEAFANNNSTGVLVTIPFKVNDGFHGETEIVLDMDRTSVFDTEFNTDFVVNKTDAKVNAHTYKITESTQASCTLPATEKHSCTVEGCNAYVVIETAEAKGHTPVRDDGVAPDCTTDGKTEGSHCSVCNEVLVAQLPVSASGHKEVKDEGFAATCTVAGKTDGAHCSVCNEVLTAQTEIPAPGHTVVKDAAVTVTCTTDGKTEGEHCSVCNEVLTAQETIKATGHNYGEFVIETAATAKKDGLQVKTCANCNDKISEVIPATGSDFPWWIVVVIVVVVAGGAGAFCYYWFVIRKKKANA
jgi:flagellar basal body-associated protein FliL